MQYAAIITNIINNIFHIIWFTCITIEPKYSRRKTVCILSVAGFVYPAILMIGLRQSIILDRNIYMAGYLLASLFFGITYIFVISVSHPVKSVFLMSGYYCLWTFIYSVISIVTNSFAGAGNMAIWLLRIGLNLFFLLLYKFFFRERIVRIYRDIQYSDGNIAVLSLLTFYILTLLLFYNEKRQSYNPLNLCVLISVYVFTVSVYVVLFRFMEQQNDKWKLKEMRLHEEILLEQINSYKRMEQSVRQTRHDFRHHNLVVEEFARNRDYQGILDYLKKYEEEETVKYEPFLCANPAVNNVLSAYAARAEKQGIDINMDIRLGDTPGISDFDMVSILANILENAVNGCMQLEKNREIRFFLHQKGRKLVIVCKNTCIADVPLEDGMPVNKNHDSIGIESILQSVGKYSGDVNFSAVDGTFTCQVILNNKT